MVKKGIIKAYNLKASPFRAGRGPEHIANPYKPV
jgi:hypothetical protein